jgi:gamma-glutamyl hercynylcysteine S-oxide hydrolase
MCRHLAYLGPPITLASVLYDRPHALVRQSWAPRQQRFGTINADGYGVGWYEPDVQPEPARFRRAGPMWADRSLESLSRVVRSGAFLAAVRSATPPAPIEETGAAPFTDGRWLFSLNGAVTGDLVALRGQVSRRRQAGLTGASDAEILFALLLDRLDRLDRLDAPDGSGDCGPGDCGPEQALADLVRTVPGRLNLLLTDGATIWATVEGDTLYWRPEPGGDPPGHGASVIVASEPLDDEPDWVPVPDRSRLTATSDGVSVVPASAMTTRTVTKGTSKP